MRRRELLKSSIAAVGVAGMSSVLGATAAKKNDRPAREFYELRLYHLRRGPKQKLFEEYVRDAAIPAMNRAGIGPIGVFNAMISSDNPKVYVLIPYGSLDAFALMRDRLRDDAEYQKAGAEFINPPATDPAYVRVESSLMTAFAGMPKLEVPTALAEKKPRIFELRTYESHCQKANSTKVEMFNTAEIALFRRVSLVPVFFGETLIGTNLPNLTYMLVHESMASRDANWGKFRDDPEWKKLSTSPGYGNQEIVSKISIILLEPASSSQI